MIYRHTIYSGNCVVNACQAVSSHWTVRPDFRARSSDTFRLDAQRIVSHNPFGCGSCYRLLVHLIFIDIIRYHSRMSKDRTPLFVRLPRDQAAALDRLADATGRQKQSLVSELLGDRLAAARPLAVGRVEVTNTPEAGDEVLTLDEA